MEKVIKIEGGHPLHGTVTISGSKNATVALIPACVLANEPITIYGVPNISDVRSLIVLLRELGVNVEEKEEGTLYIDPTNMKNTPLISDAATKLRASYYFMGALLGKYGHAEIRMPGGCYLGPRPINLHIKGFEALGAYVDYENGCYILHADRLVEQISSWIFPASEQQSILCWQQFMPKVVRLLKMRLVNQKLLILQLY